MSIDAISGSLFPLPVSKTLPITKKPVSDIAQETKPVSFVVPEANTKKSAVVDIVDVSVPVDAAASENTLSPASDPNTPATPDTADASDPVDGTDNTTPPAPPAPPRNNSADRISQVLEDYFNNTGMFGPGMAPTDFWARIQFMISNIMQAAQGLPFLTYTPPVTNPPTGNPPASGSTGPTATSQPIPGDVTLLNVSDNVPQALDDNGPAVTPLYTSPTDDAASSVVLTNGGILNVSGNAPEPADNGPTVIPLYTSPADTADAQKKLLEAKNPDGISAARHPTGKLKLDPSLLVTPLYVPPTGNTKKQDQATVSPVKEFEGKAEPVKFDISVLKPSGVDLSPPTPIKTSADNDQATLELDLLKKGLLLA